jgi:hypothetical protein
MQLHDHVFVFYRWSLLEITTLRLNPECSYFFSLVFVEKGSKNKTRLQPIKITLFLGMML